ncbi:hypothetical protein BDF20DRAFT_970636 [Mycotypha africana]|uniref:uncharacterized protein n=1 Tax=Mycotypha africana TaxID=64632 RepID=UPI0022FFF5D5|nr:uncharacterized protein BDF20DRAFT_970636 [Mycotypha africana]KAI8988391.1 hypothetical protein BDF20DRAFT_970636 [Mycotypha africana]
MNNTSFQQHNKVNADFHHHQRIATAPQVPSSANLSFYDPRTNYYTPTEHSVPLPTSYAHSTSQCRSQSQRMPSVTSVTTLPSATDEISRNKSLPPLSHLLTSKSNQPKNAKNSSSPVEKSPPSSIHVESTQELDARYQHPSLLEQEMPPTSSTVATIQPNMLKNVAPMPSRPYLSHNTTFSMTATPPVPSQSPLGESPAAYRKHQAGTYSTSNPTAGGYYMLTTNDGNHHSQYDPPPPNPMVPLSSDLSLLPTTTAASHHNTATTPIYTPPTATTVVTNEINLNTLPSRQFYSLPSPPTSVIDGMLITADPNHPLANIPLHPPNVHSMATAAHTDQPHQKVFSFVPLPGPNQKKRPRRKFHEVERLYQCNYQDCEKAYGTLNHLNAHVSMQRHGPKRQPSEFKELRKIWRQQKKEHKQRLNETNKTLSIMNNKKSNSNNSSSILNHHLSAATTTRTPSAYDQDQLISSSAVVATTNNVLASPNTPTLYNYYHHQHHFTPTPSMTHYMQHHQPSYPMPPPPPPPPPPPSLSTHWMNTSRLPPHPQHAVPPPPSASFASRGY